MTTTGNRGVIRQTVEWSVDRQGYKLILENGQGELITPDGQSLSLPLRHWTALNYAIHQATRRLPPVGAETIVPERPPKTGKAWSKEDEHRLMERWSDGKATVEALATEFGRNEGGIVSRLAKLGAGVDRDAVRAENNRRARGSRARPGPEEE